VQFKIPTSKRCEFERKCGGVERFQRFGNVDWERASAASASLNSIDGSAAAAATSTTSEGNVVSAQSSNTRVVRPFSLFVGMIAGGLMIQFVRYGVRID
jgi:hypothetical protein